MDIGIIDFTIGTFIAIAVIFIGNLIWKNYHKKKSFLLVKEKYELYRKQKYIVFDAIHPLMIGNCNPNDFCRIDENSFTIKGQKYSITKQMKINYKMSSLESRHSNSIYIYLDKEKYSFNSNSISPINVLSFLIIIYLIQNEINEITPEIVDEILFKLER